MYFDVSHYKVSYNLFFQKGVIIFKKGHLRQKLIFVVLTTH